MESRTEPLRVPRPHEYAARLRDALTKAGIDVETLRSAMTASANCSSRTFPEHLVSPSAFRQPSDLKANGYPERDIRMAMRTAERMIAHCVEELRKLVDHMT